MSPDCPLPAYYRPLPGVPAVARRSMLPALPPEKKSRPGSGRLGGVFTNRAQDLLHRAVQEINGDKKYKLIINTTALIDADSTLNITPAVLAKVNELYAADKKAVKK